MVKSRKPKSPTPCLSTVLWSPASFIHLDIFSYYLLLVFGIFIALCKRTKLFVVPSPPRCNFLMITDKHKCPSMKLITLSGCQLSIFLIDISKKFAFYYRFRDTFYWFRTLFFHVHFFSVRFCFLSRVHESRKKPEHCYHTQFTLHKERT